ncbi:SdrD B-like domain-containing protein, partial [Rhodovulum sp. DZ06]|uniref:SdrD B-like domain-containing protein n=1 Tax=Rhodovulum sp. DZ06 TaxID=3425126 RepID=UPI003D34B49F
LHDKDRDRDRDCDPRPPKDCDPDPEPSGKASLGNRVWIDADRDGIQDADEVGLAGAVVALWRDGVDTGLTATTDADGFYLFEGLAAGSYSIAVSALPETYVFTLQDAGGDDALDSDVDANGVSGPVTLGRCDADLSLDAGVYEMSVVIAPTLMDDDACTCWTETPVLDVLANDDPGLAIAGIDGMAVAAGASVTLASGALVTLNADGTLTYDGVDAWAGLAFGEMATETFTYTAVAADGGSAQATVSIDIHASNIKTIEDIEAIKPDTVEVLVNSVAGGGFVIDVLSPDAPRFEALGSADVYCVDFFGDVPDGFTVTAEVFLADEGNAALGAFVQNRENLDLVTWVLNQDFTAQGYTAAEVQNAIWNLTDDLFIGFEPGAVEIAEMARAEGEGFVAGEGDLVGLVLAPLQEVDDAGAELTNHQNLIYGVEYGAFADCLCM